MKIASKAIKRGFTENVRLDHGGTLCHSADLYHLLLSFWLQVALFLQQGDKECSMTRELWKFSVVLNITLALCALLNRLCNRTVLTNTFVVSYPSFASVQCHGVDCHCLTTCNITYNLYVVALSQFMPSKAFSWLGAHIGTPESIEN